MNHLHAHMFRAVCVACLLSTSPATKAREPVVELAKPAIGPESSAASSGAAASDSLTDVLARSERLMYRLRVQHAMIYVDHFSRPKLLQPLQKRLADKRPFDDAASKLLTLHTQTLVAIDGPMLEVEVPKVYAEWDQAMGIVDGAASASLYQPPEDLQHLLVVWRARRDDSRAVDSAPWVQGPAEVTFDVDIAPVVVPAGVWYLDPAACGALDDRRAEIRAATRAAIEGKLVTPARTSAHRGVACLHAADRSWDARLAVVDRGRMTIDATLPLRAGSLLAQKRSRSNPISNLNFQANGSYSETAVRWVISPRVDPGQASARWAITDGAQNRPLGIDRGFVKFGATKQVVVWSERLKAADILREIDEVPTEIRDRFTAERTVARFEESIAPLEGSLRFLPSHRYEDAGASTPRNPTPQDELITGTPSRMEIGVKRMLAEQKRKENVFTFLWDHVGLVATFLALLVAGIGRRRAA